MIIGVKIFNGNEFIEMSDEKELTFFDNLENRNKILKDFDIGKRKINLICCLITSF